jgi:hypothetical protein
MTRIIPTNRKLTGIKLQYNNKKVGNIDINNGLIKILVKHTGIKEDEMVGHLKYEMKGSNVIYDKLLPNTFNYIEDMFQGPSRQ